MQVRPKDESLRDGLYRVFGPRALDAGLFYAHAPALRFELSRGGSAIDQFTQAYDRIREIVPQIFGDDARLTAVIVCYDPDTSIRALVTALRRCGVRTGRPRACWRDQREDSDRTLLAFTVHPAMLNGLLWAAIAADLGIHPRLPATVYLADLERGILIHPYDDRGMDVIATQAGRLAEWFHRFRGHLLAYDVARMESFFA